MSKFVTKNIDSIIGKQQFHQLLILDESIDLKNIKVEEEKGVLDLYEDSLEEKYRSSLRGIIAIMNRVANLQSVAKEKFRDVTPQGEYIKEYEFKFQDLRILAIKKPNGQIVVYCGYKNDQDSDFRKFRSLKKQYLQYLKKA